MYSNLLFSHYSMKKFKFLILAAVATSLLANSLAGVRSSSTDSLSDANVDLDYVFIENDDDATDVSDEAEENDNDSFEAFANGNEDTQYLYLGASSPFDRLLFLVERGLEADEDADLDLTWQYSDGDDWKTLSLDEDEVDNFEDEGTLSIQFDAPSAWDEVEYEGKDAYWIRAELEGEVEEGVLIDQISGVSYNLSVTVTDEGGNAMTKLDDDNFKLYEINDNTVSEWSNVGAGEYQFAINTDDDENFIFVVDVEDYMEYSIQIDELDSDVQSYKIQLTLQTGCEAPFADTDYHWSQTAVELLYCRGIIEGEDSTIYGVNRTVTRIEFLKMAMMNADINTSKYEDRDVPFSDVDEDEWYYEYVAAAYALDAIDEDSKYYPEGEISRVEALTILVRMAGMEGSKTATRFSDISSSDWYASAVRVATDYEVVEGYPDGTFKPDRNLSRAEAAVMINNAYDAWFQN